MAKAQVADLVDLSKLEWLDLSDLVRMDEDWRRTLVVSTRLFFAISLVLALLTLVIGVVDSPESAELTLFLCGGVIVCTGAMGYLLWSARQDEDLLLRRLWPLVILSIISVTFTVFLLRNFPGDFFLLYFLPVIGAAGYLGFAGGLGTGIMSALAYASIVLLSTELSPSVLTTLLLRSLVFILVAGLFGLIAERHLSLLDALRASHTQAIHLAVSDSKTGLFNQRYVSSRLRSEIARAERAKLPLSFLMIDIDGLERINKENDFATGDSVLDALGKIIQRQLRATDVPARWGDDEFGILLYNSPLEGARIVAQRIADDLGKANLKNSETNQPIRVTVTQGIASFPEHSTDRTGQELIERAEQAILTGRKQNPQGNTIAVYSA